MQSIPDLVADAPQLTALACAVLGGLLVAACLGDRLGVRFGVPLSLTCLLIGMLAGSDGPGGIWFDRYDISYGAGTASLVLILFSGGLGVHLKRVRKALAPAICLSTLGVLGVGSLTFLGARLLGVPLIESSLIGAIVSSTDAAAIFACLKGVKLPPRLGMTLELESGFNDPMAVLMTFAVTEALAAGQIHWGELAMDLPREMAVGAAMGLACGQLGVFLHRSFPRMHDGLHATLAVGWAFGVYGLTSMWGGSGFLAVYLTGMMMSRLNIPAREHIVVTLESLSWLAQVVMFLMLGLLVFPMELPEVALEGVGLALFIALVARPVVVGLLLAPFRFSWRETVFIGAGGLRGAMPIILATVPVLSLFRHPELSKDAFDTFDYVFFVVLVGMLVPGALLRPLAGWLGLSGPAATEQGPPAVSTP